MKKVIPIVIVIILVISGIAGYYFVVIYNPVTDSDRVHQRPNLTVTLIDTEKVDYIILWHMDKNGDQVNLTRYKIIITDASDTTSQTSIIGFKGELKYGQFFMISNITHPELNEIDIIAGEKYIVEIISRDHHWIELEIICESEIAYVK